MEEKKKARTKKEKLVNNEEKNNIIKTDLESQLKARGLVGLVYEDLINDYIYLLRVKDSLQEDISKSGVKYKVLNGNGFKIEKDNPSLQNILKVNTQMLKILSDLGLREPSLTPSSIPKDDEDDLLSRD